MYTVKPKKVNALRDDSVTEKSYQVLINIRQ